MYIKLKIQFQYVPAINAMKQKKWIAKEMLDLMESRTKEQRDQKEKKKPYNEAQDKWLNDQLAEMEFADHTNITQKYFTIK